MYRQVAQFSTVNRWFRRLGNGKSAGFPSHTSATKLWSGHLTVVRRALRAFVGEEVLAPTYHETNCVSFTLDGLYGSVPSKMRPVCPPDRDCLLLR
jgi:hypothetical protein